MAAQSAAHTVGDVVEFLDKNADQKLATEFSRAWQVILKSSATGLSNDTTLSEFGARFRELAAFRSDTVLRESGGRATETLKTFESMAPKGTPEDVLDVLVQLDRCFSVIGKDKSRFVATKAFFELVKKVDADAWAADFIAKSCDPKKAEGNTKEEGSGWAKNFLKIIGPHYEAVGGLDLIRPVIPFLTECLLTPDAMLTADISTFPSRTLVAETIVVFFLNSGKVSVGFSHDVAKRELRKVMKIIDEKTINPYDKAHGFDTDELTATGEVAIITTNQLFTPTNNVNDLARAANGRAAPQAKAAVPAFATTRVSGTANRAMAGRRLKRARTPAEKQIIGQQCYNCAEGRHDYSTCTAPFKEKIPGVRYLNGTPQE